MIEQGCLIHDRQPIEAQIAALVKLAEDHGWSGEVSSEMDLDEQVDLSDELEIWLNENVAKYPLAFGWHDGEFFYMPVSWWEEG